MGRYIAKRCLYILAVFALLTFLLFSLYRLMPANRAYTDARNELQSLKNSIQDIVSGCLKLLYQFKLCSNM